MNRVLIVVDDLSFQRNLGIALHKYINTFEVKLANDGEEAISILENFEITLLVTDIELSNKAGRSLLDYVNRLCKRIPYIVISAQLHESFADYPAINPHFLNKPFTINKLVDLIKQILKPERPGGTLQGISVANFLQMIELEQKTCLLEVTSIQGETGILYLENGVLHDAVYRNLEGEAAACELIAMDEVRICFADLPEQAVVRRINKNLMGLIMEALKRKDEA